MHISWARLASFCHLGFTSDPQIVSKFHNETYDPKGQENKIYTIVKGRETFYRRHRIPQACIYYHTCTRREFTEGLNENASRLCAKNLFITRVVRTYLICAQTLPFITNADASSRDRGRSIFCLNLHLHPYIVYASTEGSGASAHLHTEARIVLRCSKMQYAPKFHEHEQFLFQTIETDLSAVLVFKKKHMIQCTEWYNMTAH